MNGIQDFDAYIGSYVGSLIVETISSVNHILIDSRSEDIFFTSALNELESANLRMSHFMGQTTDCHGDEKFKERKPTIDAQKASTKGAGEVQANHTVELL
ncbi:hypothetical protein KSC_071470 [Ktedonobacter sp. SOSP1-52]|nr:hypothetical protein KSC_071470 [Ktedonobacter sp. SOSP1-52]